jgi:hypothetical protein
VSQAISFCLGPILKLELNYHLDEPLPPLYPGARQGAGYESALK